MDPRANPFAPGAGTPPPELAGRDGIISDADVALGRVKAGLPAKSQILLGLRGVGKTVLLNRISELARAQGYEVIELEAPEDRALPDMLVPPLRKLLFKLSGVEKAKNLAYRGLAVLRSFAAAFKVKYADVEVGVSSPGTADSGNLESDLPELLVEVATAAKAAQVPIAMFVDEIQYLSEEDLAALIVADHKIAQRGLPFVLFGAGLPMVAGLAGEAKSYAERLFDYPGVGPLPEAAAGEAIREPLRKHGIAIEPGALALIIEKTKGYPYFLQEWGYHTWNLAGASPITAQDAERTTTEALRRLDSGFFQVRWDRLTPRERDYMRAMAALGLGPHRSADIAAELGIQTTSAAPIRSNLIKKGMVYSPQHGDTAFTVPMFDEYMRRAMPEWISRGSR
jgi:hypothetical protein